MPIAIVQGNTAKFVVEFLDAGGNLIIPSSGNLSVTYKSGGISAVATIGLSLNNSFWTGSWDTTPADLGLATWVVSSPASSSPAATDQINVIDP